MSFIRISIYIIRPMTKQILDAMQKIGIKDYNIVAGRLPLLEEKSNKGFFDVLFPGSGIIDEPIDIIQFLILADKEEGVLKYLIKEGQLMCSGRGSIYSENVDIPKANVQCLVNQIDSAPVADKTDMLEEISGICCIVQRGQGESIAETVLQSGLGAPNVTFGAGTGVRDKMGLLRITIPADKELVWMTASNYDIDMVMDKLIKAGQLDQPGKGFIYIYPLRKGILNMQVSKGVQKSAANMEQIVTAIDRLQGGIEWRRRDFSEDSSNRVYLENLIDFTLICDEGGADELVPVAMAAGAAGATITKIKRVGDSGELAKSRESCEMIVSKEVCESILTALEGADAFGDKFHSQVITHETTKAFTYLGGSK
jgi:nitrogen regulatory protein PII